MHSVLVVGQTPPPFGGQAVMIEQLLNCEFRTARVYHVRMAFSEDMDAIGRVKLQKVWHLVSVIFRILYFKVCHRPSVLYYPPAGPNRVPFYRDAIILILTRWLFRHTIFHFHASGISTLYPRLNRLERWLFHLAYWKPSVAISTSALNPDDGALLHARRSLVVENGLPDLFLQFTGQVADRMRHPLPRILFVGALYKSKGIGILIDACRILRDRGLSFELECVGRFESLSYESEIKTLIEEAGLSALVFFPGVLCGDEKWSAYARADIFCFPSFFESESFGLVNIEAMQFELPVVSTNWRGIPGVVSDGETGFLVDIQSPEQTADRLGDLIENSELRTKFGKAGRAAFLERFSESIWRNKMEAVFAELNGENTI